VCASPGSMTVFPYGILAYLRLFCSNPREFYLAFGELNRDWRKPAKFLRKMRKTAQ
jgi:hypothetical protein